MVNNINKFILFLHKSKVENLFFFGTKNQHRRSVETLGLSGYGVDLVSILQNCKNAIVQWLFNTSIVCNILLKLKNKVQFLNVHN